MIAARQDRIVNIVVATAITGAVLIIVSAVYTVSMIVFGALP